MVMPHTNQDQKPWCWEQAVWDWPYPESLQWKWVRETNIRENFQAHQAMILVPMLQESYHVLSLNLFPKGNLPPAVSGLLCKPQLQTNHLPHTGKPQSGQVKNREAAAA